MEPISESKIGYELGKSLLLSDIQLKYVCTDGDGRMAEGLDTAMKEIDPNNQVQRLADTIHMGQSQFRAAKKANFRKAMFPGSTLAEKQEFQNNLAIDLKDRSFIIMNRLFEMYNSNISQILQRLPKVIDATIDCYAGDCKMCRRHSIVCGGGIRNSWWHKSKNFDQKRVTFDMDDGDRMLIREILKMKLSKNALDSMKFNSNTQRNESFFRAVSASLPKNVNFSRNALARAHSTAHRITHGSGSSTLLKLEYVGAPITKGGAAAKALKRMDIEDSYFRDYARRPKVKQHKQFLRIKEIKDYKINKNSVAKKPDPYRKGQLDPKVNLKRPKRKDDHAYSKAKKL